MEDSRVYRDKLSVLTERELVAYEKEQRKRAEGPQPALRERLKLLLIRQELEWREYRRKLGKAEGAQES